jgi:AAT family amino acid transporter
LKQPTLGIVGFVVSFVFSIIAIWIVNYGLGALDHAFAPDRPGGLGFLTGCMFVMLGFYFYGASVAQWGHWPWTDAGVKQPMVGVGELLMCTVIALAGYLILVYPNLAVWAGEGGRVVDMSTALGWFYSVIVMYILTISITENWPYSLCKTRAGTVVSSIIGNFLVGTIYYFFSLWLLKSYLIPLDVQQALGSGINSYPAELGVCFVLWLLMWTYAFGNWPTHLSNGMNMLVRLVITFVLGVLSYLIYYNWGFWRVLHEPAIAGSYGGDALLWMDWVIFFLFAYAFAFNFWPFTRKE